MAPNDAIGRPFPGAHYRETAEALADEANQLFEARRFDEAEDALRELLRLQKRVVGEHHADFAFSLSMLGELCYVRGDLDQAEGLIRRALEIRGRVWGERHLDYATSLNSLAVIHWNRGQIEAAETLLERTLAIRRQRLGDNHPDAIRTRQGLETLRKQRLTQGLTASGTADARESRPAGSNELGADLGALRDWFHKLEGRLVAAVEGMRTIGELPSAGLIEELDESRLGFQRLCDRSRLLAGELRRGGPPLETPRNLQELARLLDELTRVSNLQAASEAARRRALAILDDVLATHYRARTDFAPLESCRERARVLRDEIAGAAWDSLPAAAHELAREEHPFADLMTLIRHREGLTDEDWARIHGAVGAAFGRTLAAAASRGNLGPAAVEPAPFSPIPREKGAAPGREQDQGGAPSPGPSNHPLPEERAQDHFPVTTVVIGGPLSLGPADLPAGPRAAGPPGSYLHDLRRGTLPPAARPESSPPARADTGRIRGLRRIAASLLDKFDKTP